MNILKNRIITLFFTFLIISPAPVFAAGFFANKDVIWQESINEFFKYADQDKSSFGKNDHPVELEAREISTVLGSLKIQRDTQPVLEKELKPVFTALQAKLLGQYLAKGLKNTKPNQDIIFAMERRIKRSIGLKENRFFVAGRAFYKDDKLNIIIGDYERPSDDGYEAAVDPTHVGIVRYHFDHGKRSKTSRFDKTIISINGVKNKQLNNTRRNDWLMIDVKVALEAYNRKTDLRKKEEMAKKRKELKEILGSEETNHSEVTIPHEQTDRSIEVTGTIEGRLTTLKQLRDKKLITDEEYAQKRKQILDEL